MSKSSKGSSKRTGENSSLDLFASLFVEEPELARSEADELSVVAASSIPAMPKQQEFRDRPPDAAERSRALDLTKSFVVQAPAGSGKTHLLTQRFLGLLSRAEKPEEILAITFTNAAAAEMRQRVLSVLEKAESDLIARDAGDGSGSAVVSAPDLSDGESLEALAHQALARARLLDWRLLDQPGQLRITTIDAFCRNLALQCPLSWGQLSGLGGRLDPIQDATDLYRQAAAHMMDRLLREEHAGEASLRRSIEALLLWRDNNWQDVQGLIVEMLKNRNRWVRDFVFARDPDWDLLRKRLEAPFRKAARGKLETLVRKLDRVPGSRERLLELAQFACEEPGDVSPLSVKELAELPTSFIAGIDEDELAILKDAVLIYRELACFLLTEKQWRKGLNKNQGFPTTDRGRAGKKVFQQFVGTLEAEPGILEAFADCSERIVTSYTDEEWELVRHCFAVLRAAAVELQLVFAQTGSVDFTEVSQIALRVLAPENGFPSDFAIRQADGIRHLLVDEFQDTSRNQHQLIARLIAAWPDREGRSCFCVGDPMQSIYGFRDAEVELFERLKTHGLEIENEPGNPFRFEFVSLQANFRTTPSLVNDLNIHFQSIFAAGAESGVEFSEAVAVREGPMEGSSPSQIEGKAKLHLAFTLRKLPNGLSQEELQKIPGMAEQTRKAQLGEIVTLIQSKLQNAPADWAEAGGKYRIAVLGRVKKSLIIVAEALRKAKISYRAIELVPLGERPEVLDAVSMIRALLNPADRTAWLGLLRAPWCGLSLEELHRLVSADDTTIARTTVPVLLGLRLEQLSRDGQISPATYVAASRVRDAMRQAAEARPAASTVALGTWLESVWKALGGEATVNDEQRANVRLLWSAIDKLPSGELDLLGAALPTLLKQLCALPDPAASSAFGVQLMTIHKSKGLEFEVVVVPDLEANTSNRNRDMVSWLERGVSDAESEEITEFLIGPIQAKGDKAGSARAWVEEVKREREIQERKRLLYVAATRAREELHLFARPRFSMERGKTPETATPAPVLCGATGLLETGWPAFAGEVKKQFEEWVAEHAVELQRMAGPRSEGSVTVALAASVDESQVSAASNLLVMAENMTGPVETQNSAGDRAIRPTVLRRLPLAYVAPDAIRVLTRGGRAGSRGSQGKMGTEELAPTREKLYLRNEGGLEARLAGIAIHSFLEQLTRLRQATGAAGEPHGASRRLTDFLPGVIAQLRSRGFPLSTARGVAEEALAVAQRSSIDEAGAWIFAPHAHAQTEASWTGVFDGALRTVRADRVFFATPPAFLNHEGTADTQTQRDAERSVWWVIDYKTTHAPRVDISNPEAKAAFLRSERTQFSEQLEVYAGVLRKLLRNGALNESKGDVSIRVGIYYPRLRLFDSWES